jgi:hypothetical protein
MLDQGYAHRAVLVDQLVDDPIRADMERAKAAQPTAELVSDEGFAFQQPQRIFDGVDYRPVELEQLSTSATREDDSGHRLSG